VARRELRRPSVEHQSDPPLTLAAQDVDLLNAMRQLTPQQRAAVALYYFEDRPLPEVAHILGCSHAAAKVHVFNARRRLALLLGEEVVDVARR
jgi:RNA polymerase sigma factor (sigma-70 family)